MSHSKFGVVVGALILFFSAAFPMFAFADMFDTTTQAAQPSFTHMETGFPLTGYHGSVECATCHVGGVFKGTPRNCAGCHTKGRRVIATYTPTNHIATSEPCELCHTNTVTFSGARFNHYKVTSGSCITCHNGVVSTGKPANHSGGLRVSESCERCHRTYAWIPALFNHTGVVQGTCAAQCHNGSIATGRPGSHTTRLKATSGCDTCHRLFGWYPTFFDHTSVVSGSCSTCHNGTDATNRPASHTGYKVTLACDSCHNTSVWTPAVYNHSGIASGTCATCHLAQRPASHTSRGYTSSCDNCHTISSSWTFNHALQQGKHTCNSCHAHHNNSTPCDYCHSVSSWGR